MQTPRVNWNPPLTKHLVQSGVFRAQPFSLVDVGASGGIDGYWEIFGDSLCAVGFDGLIKEVERLNATMGDRNRKYYPYLVGDKNYRRPEGVPDTQPFPRTSAVRATAIANCNYAATYFDQTGSGLRSTETVELDQFFLRDHPAAVDFIKVDTDGSDYEVLLGAKELLTKTPVLGVAVECQFHGLVHDASNTFRNIDRFLTSLGFSLFDLEVYRYSRAVLPKLFVYRIPAQTHGGQVLWGDALYVRDMGNPDYEKDWSIRLSPQQIIKLACILEIFGMEDCTAELLLKYASDIRSLVDVERCLDLLTPAMRGRSLSYSRYTQLFESDPTAFYPSD
jgi:FkbM family methyltransferase